MLDGDFEDDNNNSNLSLKDLLTSSRKPKEEKKSESKISNFFDYDKDDILNVSSEANIVY